MLKRVLTFCKENPGSLIVIVLLSLILSVPCVPIAQALSYWISNAIVMMAGAEWDPHWLESYEPLSVIASFILMLITCLWIASR